jgi:cytochrome c553
MPTTYYRSTSYRHKPSRARSVLLVLGALLGVFGLIQLVPYGHDHTDPPVTAPFKWTSTQAEAIAKRSCYACHSNQSNWWWAIKIAPFSWLAQHDISVGRARVNFSEWNGGLSSQGLQYALANGMPPLQFTLLHPGATLSAAEKQQLVAGFQQSLADQQNGSGLVATSSTAGSSSGSDPTAIIVARCGSCHSSAPAQQFRASSAAEAKALIDQMIQQGATITPAEEQALIKYYTS